MKRLFACTVSLIYEDTSGFSRVSSLVADKRTEFWWDPKRPEERTLWDSKIRLGEAFFNEIIGHPIPLDMNILKALKRSSLGLDLYLWLDLPHLLAQPRATTPLEASLPPIRSGSSQGR